METEILSALLRTTIFLSVSGAVCFLVLRRIGDRIPQLSRLLWLGVLLSGWFWVQGVITIPWKTTLTHETKQAVTQPQPPIDELKIVPFEFQTEPILIPAEVAVSYGNVVTPSPKNVFEGKAFVLSGIFITWIVGMCVSSVLSLSCYVKFILSLRKTVPASDEFAEPWRRLLEMHRFDPRTIPMYVSQSDPTFGPALIRIVRGYSLVVPHELWSELPESGRLGILKHELAHFQRRDVWKSFFARILVLPHWFNPIAHLAMHRFDEAAEQLCDRAAYQTQKDGIMEFARTLLLLHENAPTQFVARQSIFGRGLKHRVACLLLENHTKKVSPMKKILLITGMIAVLAFGLFRIELVEKIVAQLSPSQKTKTLSPGIGNYIDQALMNTNCSIQMKQLHAAMLSYYKENGSFPRPHTCNENKEPLHNWKVTILPYLGQKELYDKIRKDEPWDSEYNKQFHAQCPAVFQCPFALAEFPDMKSKGQTTYSLVVGETAYPETQDLALGKNFYDGTANTMMICERKTPACWMDPLGDIRQTEAEKGINRSEDGIGLSHQIESQRNTLMCFFNGTIVSIQENLTLRALGAMITPNGGESVPIHDYEEKPAEIKIPPPIPAKTKTIIPLGKKPYDVPLHGDNESPLGFFRTKGKSLRHENEEKLVDFYRIGCMVFLPDGSPAKNATIFYSFGLLSTATMGSIKTDENGYFKTEGIESGMFRNDNGMESAYFTFFNALAVLDNTTAQTELVSPLVSFNNSERVPLERFELRLQKGTVVTGKVTQQGQAIPKGQVQAALEYPIADPKETAYFTRTFQLTAETDEHGNYRFVFPPGRFYLCFSGTPWDEVEGTAPRTQDEQTIDLNVAPKTRLHVRQSNGEPVSQATFFVGSVIETFRTHQDAAKRSTQMSYQMRASQTDEQGNCELYISPLSNIIRCQTQTEGGSLILEGKENIGQDRALTLQPFAQGKIQIFSKITEKPIAGVKVKYESRYVYDETQLEYQTARVEGDPVNETETDENGYAFFPNMIAGDSYRLTLQDLVPKAPRSRELSKPEISGRFVSETPGQKTDLGVVVLDGDFSSFAPDSR